LEQSLRACAGSLAGRQLCVDGKAHRATTPAGQRQALVRTVSVWVADAHLSFGQAQIGAKKNEKTAIPALLDTLEAAGGVAPWPPPARRCTPDSCAATGPGNLRQ